MKVSFLLPAAISAQQFLVLQNLQQIESNAQFSFTNEADVPAEFKEAHDTSYYTAPKFSFN